MQHLQTDIAIVGAGLSGLALADELLKSGSQVLIFEARDRIGGRILSPPSTSQPGYRYDLGPAWIWPHNARMLALIDRFGLELFPQHSTGNLVFQGGDGAVRRDLGFSTMEGAYRLKGGLASVPEALGASLPANALNLGHQVDEVKKSGPSLSLFGTNSAGRFSVDAQKIVFALPPRLIANQVSFEPELPHSVRDALAAVPTWMAGHGKVVAVYSRVFWREAGLSGDAISHAGPLFEIHDASPVAAPNDEAALFGFIHPSQVQAGLVGKAFREKVISQLADLFGPNAADPLDFQMKAWFQDRNTATLHDSPDLNGHPTYAPLSLDATWNDSVFLSGAETAVDNGGFLEGALEAAEYTARKLQSSNQKLATTG